MNRAPAPHIKHKDCSTVIFWRNGKDGITRPALYCSEHYAWIKWLTEDEAKFAVELGVKDLGLLNDLEVSKGKTSQEYKQAKLDQLKSLLE